MGIEQRGGEEGGGEGGGQEQRKEPGLSMASAS